MIVFDASTLVGAALKPGSVPEQAVLRAERMETFAISAAVLAEIMEVLSRPKFARAISAARRDLVHGILMRGGRMFKPTIAVHDCRDPKDNKYLELALAANALIIVSSDSDLLTLSPWRGVQILRPAEYLAQP